MGIRARADVDRRFAEGFVLAKAFNDPKLLAEDLRDWERKKAPVEDVEYESDGSDILALFKRSGIKVEDTTRH